MECLVVVERKSTLRHYGGGVTQFDKAQKSNSKVDIVRCPCWPLSLLCTWGKKRYQTNLRRCSSADTSISWQPLGCKLFESVF